MQSALYTFSIVIEPDGEGYFVRCPELQGCYTQSATYDEALQNIKGAIKLHIESRLAHNEEIPQHTVENFSMVAVTV